MRIQEQACFEGLVEEENQCPDWGDASRRSLVSEDTKFGLETTAYVHLCL